MAEELGAHYYIDTGSQNAAQTLQKLGGARVILATAPNSKAISGLVDGLGPNGKLVVVAAAFEPLEVSPLQLIMGRKTIAGWPSGHARDSEATLNFSALTGVLPMIETFPLQQVTEAYNKMINNQARFRVVLTMGD
jgi:alcohol dehydrogenase/propanol-preferring alcohol dehydrogenase